MPEQGYPRTPEESVGHLQKFKEQGEQERQEPAAEEAADDGPSEQEIKENEEKEMGSIKEEIEAIPEDFDSDQKLDQGGKKEFRKQMRRDGHFGILAKSIEKFKKLIGIAVEGKTVELKGLDQGEAVGQDFDPDQQLDEKGEKEFREKISQDRFGDFGKFVKGAASAPAVFLGGLAYGVYKSVKILFWDHWLKKYFGGLIDTLKGPSKKQ
ncbi:hypothetical protein KJ969_02405 [Patescibacteria group bacterium]|nr:hypothetical protein [Patescibacteria group bacterium]MBU1921882.1 hypothetical protein [Patescibacteria group bacterium]